MLAHADKLLSGTDRPIGMTADDIVLRIKQYVDRNYMEDIVLASLAAEYGVTPNYLSTLFRKKIGTTFIRYVTDIRMHKAKELLVTKPDMKVHDVSASVGYLSQRHFTKLFYEHFQCYPSEIRQQMLQQTP